MVITLRGATPREQGQFAKEDGKRLADCPFSKGTKPYKQWVSGYLGRENS